MQEKINELSLAELKAMAKELGLKGFSTLRKAELVGRLEAAVSEHTGKPAEKSVPEAAEQEKTVRQVQEKTPEKDPSGSGIRQNNAQERKDRRQSADKEQNREERRQPQDSAQNREVRRQSQDSAQTREVRRQSQEKNQNRNDRRDPSEKHADRKDRRQNQGRNNQKNNNRRNEPAEQRKEQTADHQEKVRQELQPKVRRFGYVKKEEQETETLHTDVQPDGTGVKEEAYVKEIPQEDQVRDIAPAEEPIRDTAPREEEQDQNSRGRKNQQNLKKLDSGQEAYGILEVMPEGYGFIRSDNYLPGEEDIYVSPSQIRRFNMKTGDFIAGNIRVKTGTERYAALLYVQAINDEEPEKAARRDSFEDLTPIFPNERLHLERPGGSTAMRIVDILSPIGKGQRGMIVSPPKAGKTTLLKEIALATQTNHPDVHIIILLIDERPEEVTDIKESIPGENVEVIYSTFDEEPDHHKRVAEMVLGRAQRLVEHGRDVMILLDSITRLARAYNLTVAPSGRTLSGGLDPAALHMPKKFFGAARNMREGGSLTIMATALVDTGSRMDDVVFEEFKGTGNMELVLDRKLSERRIFPAIDIIKSGTRRDDLLLTKEEQEAVATIHRGMHGMKQEEAVEEVLRLFTRTRSNADFVKMVKTIRL